MSGACGSRRDVVIIVPARMASTRLPGKPLADICGEPMIVHVARRVRAACLGRVLVAVDHPDAFAVVERAGFEVVMTRVDHPSGSDRIYEAMLKVMADRPAEIVINVQGDLPTIEAESIRATLRPLENPAVDIATLAVEISEDAERTNPNVVKIIGTPLSQSRLRAPYFT